jgi:hypothetical protein
MALGLGHDVIDCTCYTGDLTCKSRGNAVGIATGGGLND